MSRERRRHDFDEPRFKNTYDDSEEAKKKRDLRILGYHEDDIYKEETKKHIQKDLNRQINMMNSSGTRLKDEEIEDSFFYVFKWFPELRRLSKDDPKYMRILNQKHGTMKSNLNSLKIKIRSSLINTMEELPGGHVKKFYFYTDPYKDLIPGSTFKEVNGDRSKSKEPSNILEKAKKYPDVEINVIQSDCLSVATNLQKNGFNPVIVISGSNATPGGKWGYAIGQEENLYNQTTISSSTSYGLSSYYPIKSNLQYLDPNSELCKITKPEENNILGLVYSPHVIRIRKNITTHYKKIQKSEKKLFIKTSVITCPPVIDFKYAIKEQKKKNKKTGKTEIIKIKVGNRIAPEYVKVAKLKIKNILTTGLFHGHNAIVICPWGINYENPQGHIASLFKKVIYDDRYMFYKRYKKIIFAIDPHLQEEKKSMAFEKYNKRFN